MRRIRRDCCGARTQDTRRRDSETASTIRIHVRQNAVSPWRARRHASAAFKRIFVNQLEIAWKHADRGARLNKDS
jgi:hypothetical protein